MRAIDIHAHPVFFRHGRRPAEIDRLVAHNRALGVERMVSLGDVLVYGPNPDAAQLVKINDESARLQRRHPDFFLGFCYLNPRLGERAVRREVERCVTQHGFKGIKLEIANNATDPCMRPVMRAAREHGLVVLQHSWSRTNFDPGTENHSDPDDTSLLARRHPEVEIIMAHLVGCSWRGVLAAKGQPNLYVDTSGAFPEAGLIEYAVEHLGAGRVLYGTDLPIRAASVKLGAILGADLSAAVKEQILYTNAARLLHLN